MTATLSEPGLAAWPLLAPASQMASDSPHSPPCSLILHKALLGVRSLPEAKLPPSGLACGPWVCSGLPGSPDGSGGAGGARTAGQGEPRPRAPGSCFQDPTGLRPPGHEARGPDLPARPGQTHQRAPAWPRGAGGARGACHTCGSEEPQRKGKELDLQAGPRLPGGGGEGSGFSPSSSWSRCQPPARPPAASARTQGLLPFPAWKAPSLPPHPELRAWRRGLEPPAAFPLQDPASPPPAGASMDACPGREGPAAPLGRPSLAAAHWGGRGRCARASPRQTLSGPRSDPSLGTHVLAQVSWKVWAAGGRWPNEKQQEKPQPPGRELSAAGLQGEGLGAHGRRGCRR